MERAISKPKRWLLCFALTLPALIPVALHFYLAESVWQRDATGFVQYDQAYYMANARQYFDEGEFSFAYKNPNDYRADSPRIYCQIQSLALGAICKYTGADPAYVFLGFGWLFSLLTIRVAYSLLNEFLPLKDWASHFVFVLFVWGGGLFALSGLFTWAASGATGSLYEHLVMYDPFEGWWFLNLGRNFVFPMESYYHFLFLLGALFLVRGKFLFALITGTVVAWSHPFTGVEFLSAAVGFLFMEKTFWQNSRVNWAWVFLAGVLLIAHVGYYQVFLTRFPQHREVHEMWQLAWEYKGIHMLLGYGIVGALVAWRIRTSDRCREFLLQPKHRFLIIWFAVAFLLANHEFFMKSVQPLHFTRGYVWMPLFLAGSTVLYGLCRDTREGNQDQPNMFMVILLGLILLLDNASWLPLSTTDVKHNSLHTSVDHREVMDALNTEVFDPDSRFIVVSNAPNISYLSTVLTPHESYLAHEFLTPDRRNRVDEVKNLVKQGVPIEELNDQYQLMVLVDDFALEESDDNDSRRIRVKNAYESAMFLVEELTSGDGYVVWKCTPNANVKNVLRD